MPGAALSVEIDAKAIARIRRKLEKVQGKSLYVKMQRATLAAADLLVKPIRAAGPPNKTGLLRRSVRARTAKKRIGSSLVPSTGALVGPTAPHRHLVIRGTSERPSVGTRPSSPWRKMPDGHVIRAGTFTTGRMTANPYVDRAARGHERQAAEIVRRIWFEDVR